MEPQVVALRQAECQFLVFSGIASDKNGQTIHRDKSSEWALSLFNGWPRFRGPLPGESRPDRRLNPRAFLDREDLPTKGVDFLLGMGNTGMWLAFGGQVLPVLLEIVIHVLKRRFSRVEREGDFRK